MFENVFTIIFAVSVTTGIVILALVLLSSRLNRSYAAKWKYWVWLLLAVRLLIPFYFTFPGAPVQVSVPDTAISPVFSPRAPAIPDVTPAASDLPVQSAARFMNLWELFSIIWLAGVVLFLVVQFAGYRRCRHEALRWSRAVKDKRLSAALDQLCAEMDTGEKITLLISQKVSGPMIIGFFKGYLLLPHENYEDNELVHILRHELVHLKRRDIWYKLLILFTTALHWFNPAVHLMLREANKDLELACDDESIKNLPFDARKEYSDTIIHCMRKRHSKRTALSTYFYGGEQAMRERFVNILSHQKKRAGKVAGAVVLLGVLLMGGMVACDTLNTPQIDLADYDLLYEQYLHLPFWSSITSETWDDANDIPPDYFVNYYAYYWYDNHYQGGPLNFPPKELESYIQEYFDVSAEHIRTADQYDGEEDVYICLGLGGGGSAKVVGAEQNGKRLILDYEVYSPEDNATVLRIGKLTAEMSGNGYKYVANETQDTEAMRAFYVEAKPDLNDLENLTQRYLYPILFSWATQLSWTDPQQIDADRLVDMYGYDRVWNANIPESAMVFENDTPYYYVSADILEAHIADYFDVSADHLRTAGQYDLEKNEYAFNMSGGGFAYDPHVLRAEYNDATMLLTLYIDDGYPGGESKEEVSMLIIQLYENGGFTYVGNIYSGGD